MYRDTYPINVEIRGLGLTQMRTALPTGFYNRPVEQVARGLLGACLHACIDGNHLIGMIVETEAYGGSDDLASHASFRRSGVVHAMWGPPGTLYVYKAFGMYPCFNIVTGPEGEPAAVLVRAISIQHPESDDRSASGPGRLGRYIGLDLGHNGHDLTQPPFWIAPGREPSAEVRTAQRVGVKRGDGRDWRFAISGHPAVSRPRR